MTADSRMIFVHQSGGEARKLGIDNWTSTAWCGHLPGRTDDVGAQRPARRTVDVGGPCLATVLVCSRVEALAATAATRAETEAWEPGVPHLREARLATCDAISGLLEWLGDGYFTGWVIVETADID